MRIADRDVHDITFAINQHADLATGFVGKLCHLPRKLLRHDMVWRDAALVHLFEPPQLIGLEALRLAFDLWNGM